MNQKLNVPAALTVKQDVWGVSPCTLCSNTPCCKHLPLDVLKLENYSDMVNLQLCTLFRDIIPVLKKDGEWNLYLNRNCLYIDKETGKCLIHALPQQSLICKSYDAHNCWYLEAFMPNSGTLLKFTGTMLDKFERLLTVSNSKFDSSAYDFAYVKANIEDDFSRLVNPRQFSSLIFKQQTLSFRRASAPEFLFIPPYIKPSSINHLELAEFRLGFPGVFLAIADNCWAYMIKTSINNKRLDLLRENLPSVSPDDFSYSFNSFSKKIQPFSEIGEKFVLLRKEDLPLLRSLIKINSEAMIKRLPTTAEIISEMRKGRPDWAA